MTYNNLHTLPIYEIVVDEENLGMTAVSLVHDPAIEADFMHFKKHEPVMLELENEEKRIVSGPAILADTPIYRRMNGEEFLVVFTKDTIREIVHKYMKNNYGNIVTINHNGEESSSAATIIESYFVDHENGPVPSLWEKNNETTLPDGSWYVTYKIEDDNLWNQIKTGQVKGFSIELFAGLEAVFEKKMTEDEELENALQSTLE